MIHSLVPFRTYSSPSRTARVDMEPIASLPAPGSLIPSAPMDVPAQSPGSRRRRCSSFPLRKILFAQRLSEAEWEIESELFA